MYVSLLNFTYSAPSEPNSVVAVNSSSTSITVSWTAPSMPNGMIRGYTVTYYRSEVGMSDMAQEDVTSDITSIELSGLEIFTNYTIFVEAFTTVGVGAPSDVVTVVTSEDG